MEMKQEYIIYKLSESIKTTSRIDPDLFVKYNVKRGLRNEDHSGVLVGLTKIGDVVGYERLPQGGLKAIPGKLVYRGIDVEDLVKGFYAENRFGFEETAFLLLSGYLPDKEEDEVFRSLIATYMPLEQKTKMNILDLEGQDIMNILARCVLEMYIFDPAPDDTSRENLIRQSIELIVSRPSSPMPITWCATAGRAVRSISATRRRTFRSRRISFTCSRASSPTWRRGCSIWRWCSMPSMEAVTTPLSRCA